MTKNRAIYKLVTPFATVVNPANYLTQQSTSKSIPGCQKEEPHGSSFKLGLTFYSKSDPKVKVTFPVHYFVTKTSEINFF